MPAAAEGPADLVQKLRHDLANPLAAVLAETQLLLLAPELLNAETLEIDANFQPPSRSSLAPTKLGELFLIVGETDRAAERDRLDKEIAKLEAELKATEAKLANSSFIERAPKEVVEEHQRRRDDFSARLAKLRTARGSLD